MNSRALLSVQSCKYLVSLLYCGKKRSPKRINITNLVLVVLVQIQTTLLGSLPLLRQTGIRIRLVYYLWNQLLLSSKRIGLLAGNFCARDGICGSVDKE